MITIINHILQIQRIFLLLPTTFLPLKIFPHNSSLILNHQDVSAINFKAGCVLTIELFSTLNYFVLSLLLKMFPHHVHMFSPHRSAFPQSEPMSTGVKRYGIFAELNFYQFLPYLPGTVLVGFSTFCTLLPFSLSTSA